MTHVITGGCCNDAGCVDVCPVNCIHPGPTDPRFAATEMLFIDPDTCIDCGACIDACPVGAISADHALTDDNRVYLDINATHFSNATGPTVPERTRLTSTTASGDAPNRTLKVAIVGSGPSACYSAEHLLAARDTDVEVTVFERLPVPFGLVRFGVAPDHQATKSVAHTFARTLHDPRVTLHFGVHIGEHIGVPDLLQHHDAALVATGATGDRALDTPGEQLPGSHAAREFVAWYNGHPDAHVARQGPDWDSALSTGRAVVVGNGNVAIDVARLLVMPPEVLAQTDVPPDVASRLGASEIREVVVLGRRGPDAAAFTGPELLGLAHLDWADIAVELSPSLANWTPTTWKEELLQQLADRPARPALPRIVLRFGWKPAEILGDHRVEALRMTETGTGLTSDLECGLVLRSIGYRGTPFPGLGYDPRRGIVPNAGGRVLVEPDGPVHTGVYAAGWLKRGPSGVIGTNRPCAAETVDALLEDFRAGRLSAPRSSAEQLDALVARLHPDSTGMAGWSAIDRHEQLVGRMAGSPRVKLVDPVQLLDVARSAP